MERLSWSSFPYNACQSGGSGTPGGSTPRHLPSSGFDYPLDDLLSAEPGPGPSTKAAFMGFALQGLAPPGRRRPSQGLASPVVSPSPLSRKRARLQRLTPTGKGNEARCCKQQRTPNLALLGVAPLQGLLLRRLGTGFPVRAPPTLSTGSAPYVSTPGRGSKGL
jgi:hypothetical protein